MARSLALLLALALGGCASATPPPRTMYVQQVVYVDPTPPPRAEAQRPRPPRKPRMGHPHRAPRYYGHPKRVPFRTHPGWHDMAKR